MARYKHIDTSPRFLAVVPAAAVALTLARKASGRVDGFIIAGASAGGHNAPPRGGARDAQGQPLTIPPSLQLA